MKVLIVLDVDGTLLQYSAPYFTWRPHRKVLIDTVKKLGFDLAIWTLGDQEYSNSVKDKLAEETDFIFSWSGEHASVSSSKKYSKKYKDIEKIKEAYPEYDKIILIDDDDYHKDCNNEGDEKIIFMFVDYFSASMMDDKEFLRVSELLEKIK